MKKTACIALASFIFALSHQASAMEKLSLMLDWFPNVDHLPIYVARDNDFFREAGLEVEILSPSKTSDTLKLAVAGTVDLAVGYEPQTVIAAAERLSPKVVGRLVGHPLYTLLYLHGRFWLCRMERSGGQDHRIHGPRSDGHAPGRIRQGKRHSEIRVSQRRIHHRPSPGLGQGGCRHGPLQNVRSG